MRVPLEVQATVVVQGRVPMDTAAMAHNTPPAIATVWQGVDRLDLVVACIEVRPTLSIQVLWVAIRPALPARSAGAQWKTLWATITWLKTRTTR